MFRTCFSPSGNMSADSVPRAQNLISLRKLQIQLGKTKKSAPDCQIMVFHQNPDVPDEKSRHRMNIFKSPTGSLESVSGLIIPHSNRPFLFSTRCAIWSPTWRILHSATVQTLWATSCKDGLRSQNPEKNFWGITSLLPQGAIMQCSVVSLVHTFF